MFYSIKQCVVNLVALAAAPFIIVENSARILRSLWRIRHSLGKARTVVVYQEGGYGHSIVGPDIARRLFGSAGTVVIFFYGIGPEPKHEIRHNAYVEKIWGDLKLLTIRLRHTLPILEWTVWSTPQSRLLAALVGYVAQRMGPNARIISCYEMTKLLPGADVPVSNDHYDEDNNVYRYHLLCRQAPADPLRLSADHRRRVSETLARVDKTFSGKRRKLCCLYLRNKGRPLGQELMSANRSGSEFDAYLDGANLLISRGYQIIVTGDRRVDPAISAQFEGRLVDSFSLGLVPQVVLLYAATEADIVVGDVGGGSWLPAINGIPSLLLNAFPFNHAHMNGTVAFKRLLTPEGDYVPMADLFSRYIYDLFADGLEIENNSSEFIRDCIAEFLDFVESGETPRVSEDILAMMPPDAQIPVTNARISPIWLNLYNEDKGPDAIPSSVAMQ